MLYRCVAAGSAYRQQFFGIIRNSSANKNDTTTGFGLHGIGVEVFRRLRNMAPDTRPHCINPSLKSVDHAHVSRTGTLKYCTGKYRNGN